MMRAGGRPADFPLVDKNTFTGGGPGAGTPTLSQRRIDDSQVSDRKLFKSADARDHIPLPVLSAAV